MSALSDAQTAGVFHLGPDARAIASSAASAGLLVAYVDIGHAHDKEHFATARATDGAGGAWVKRAPAANARVSRRSPVRS